MSDINVTLFGAVPEVVGNKELVSLTGSASVLNFYGQKILVDLGLFQGGEGSDLYNKENIKFISDLDAVAVTHSHIDHIGRLPLLWKLGFRGPIYMTAPIKDITLDMLLDCLKIQEGEAIIRERKNKNLESRLKKSLELKEKIIIESRKKGSFIEGYMEDLSELQEYLDFYGVKTINDIDGVLFSLKQTLFNQDDIGGVMSLIKTVNYNEELLYDAKKISSYNNNRQDQELISNLPRKIAEGFTDILEVDKDSELRRLKKRWVADLIIEVQKLLNNKELKYNDVNTDLSKHLQEAFTFCNNEYPAYINGSQGVHRKDDLYYKNKFKDDSELLDFYNINVRKDIDELFIKTRVFIDLLKSDNPTNIVEKGLSYKNNGIDNTIDILKKLINIFDLKLSFDTTHIDKAIDKIIVLNQKSKVRNVAKILYGDAAHLVGSANVTFTIEVTSKKIQDVINAGTNSISVFFSGDMGRIHDNILGRPEIPQKPANYLQIESTYGGKFSFKKEETASEIVKMICGEIPMEEEKSIDILVNLIEGKTHLEESELVVKLQELINKKEFLGKDGLMNELIKILNVKGHRNLEKSLKEFFELIKNSKGNILGSMFSQQRLQAFLLFFEEKLRIGDELSGFEIVIDAPLGKKVLSHYIKYAPEIYGVLEGLLKEGKVRFLEEGEWESLYSDENKDKKYIILASSGMMDGGAIMNHLPKILSDENAILFAPGYLSRGTLGNEIVWGNKNSVNINGESIPLKCTRKYIEGFSSHIGHDEILQYLIETINAGMLKNGATIALSHGNIEGQLELKQDIENILIELNRTDIIVTIPGIFDEYDILNRTFNSSIVDGSNKLKEFERNNNDKSINPEIISLNKPTELKKKVYKKPVVPKIIKDLEIKELVKEDEVISQAVLEGQASNSKFISELKSKKNILTKRKNKYDELFLSDLLKGDLSKKINSVLLKISKLSYFQKDNFYEIIKTKDIYMDTLDKNKRNIGTKIYKIGEIKDFIITFFEKTKLEIVEQINEFKLLLDLIKGEKMELKSNLIDFEKSEGALYMDEIKSIKNEIKLKDRSLIKIKKDIDKLYKDIKFTQNNILIETLLLLPNEYGDEFRQIFNTFSDEITFLFSGSNISIVKQIEKLEISLENSIDKNKKLKLELKLFSQNVLFKREKVSITIKDLLKSIKGTNKKILIIKSEIKKLRKELEDAVFLDKSNKESIKQDNYDEFEIIYNNSLTSDNNEKSLNLLHFLNKITDSYIQLISSIELQKNQFPVIKIDKLMPSFAGVDMYDELLDNELYNEIQLLENKIDKASSNISRISSSNDLNVEYKGELEKMKKELITYKEEYREHKNKYLYQGGNDLKKILDLNLVKLEKYIKGHRFSELELEKINSFMNIINASDTGKKNRINAKNNLTSYFKSERNNNKNLGINLNLDVEELNNNLLLLLSKIFEETYFEDTIKNNFDIYGFLKSKQDLLKYIKNRYITNNLKGVAEKNNFFSELDNHLLELFNILDGLEESSNKSMSVDDLTIIHLLINRVGNYIDKFLKQDFNDYYKQDFIDKVELQEIIKTLDILSIRPDSEEEELIDINGVIDFVKNEFNRLLV